MEGTQLLALTICSVAEYVVKDAVKGMGVVVGQVMRE